MIQYIDFAIEYFHWLEAAQLAALAEWRARSPNANKQTTFRTHKH